MPRCLTPAAGSFLWLVRHDIRLSWRGFSHMFARFDATRGTLAAAAALIALHLVAWPIAALLVPNVDEVIATGQIATIVTVALSVFAWMVAQGLIGASRALFARSDLELLLGSPLDAITVFGARALAITTSTFGSVGLLVLPTANVGALLGRPSWLFVYPVLVVLALVGTSIGLLFSMATFQYVGPRRARLVSQLVATFIAGGFVLGVQVWLLLPEGVQATLATAVTAIWGRESRLAIHVSQVLSGDVETVLLITASSLALFAVTVRLLAGPFARATLSAAGAPAEGRRALDIEQPLRFSEGFGRALRRKEWRLLLRDPGIYGQLTLQIIYTLPVAVLLMRSNQELPTGLAVASAVVVIAAQVSASLAWIAVSAEEAPELLATAPMGAGHIERYKLSAIAVPVFAVVAVPTIGLAFASVRVAVLTLLISALAAVSTALLNLWHPMPGNRRGMLRRHQQSKLVALVEHALAITWAIGIMLAVHSVWLTLIPLVVVTGILSAAAPFSPRRAIGSAIRRGLRGAIALTQTRFARLS